MVTLSVGEVSGIIAAGVFVVQLILPIAIPPILVAFLSNKNTLTTWAVLGRFLHSSHWPTILRTDTATSTGVTRSVRLTGWLQTAVLFLISLASIVTPLGLYSSIEPADSQTTVSFNYAQDTSAFGYGTPPRSTWPFTEVCGISVPCPYSILNKTCTQEGLLQNCTESYDPRIPEALDVLFSSGATNFSPSVSSIFDIQWRTYSKWPDPFSTLENYISRGYRQLSTLVLDDSVQLVEGLIVDMVSGGIGFRNHTVPAHLLPYGATWEEDILFVQPETQCVNLNVTVDYQVDASGEAFDGKPLLTDHNGFSSLDRSAPSMNAPSNGQEDINLQERAYNAAWLNNFLTLAYFNATGPDPSNITRLDVKPGQSFPIENKNFTTIDQALRMTIFYGGYLDFTSKQFKNPYDINEDNFAVINDICGGTSSSNLANINSSIVGCALLLGAANRTDGGSNLIIDPESKWSAPLFSCASAVQATVKTVTFQYNGTGLEALKVTSAAPKNYQSKSDVPRWAVQNLQGIQLGDGMPMWGILGPSNSSESPLADTWNMSTISAESLYLPGFMDLTNFDIGGPSPGPADYPSQYLPALNFYSVALAAALMIGPPTSGQYSGYNGYADYSGWTSLSLYNKWQSLSASAETASSIPNLVWTDVAANSVVGTKGWGLNSVASSDPKGFLPSSDQSSTTDLNPPSSTGVPVVIYHQTIGYRLPFGVPAIVVLTLIVVVLTTLLVLIIMGKTGLKRMRESLDATSSARIIAKLVWPPVLEQRTKQFVKGLGKRPVTITSETVLAGEEVCDDESENPNMLNNGEVTNGPNWSGKTDEHTESDELIQQNPSDTEQVITKLENDQINVRPA